MKQFTDLDQALVTCLREMLHEYLIKASYPGMCSVRASALLKSLGFEGGGKYPTQEEINDAHKYIVQRSKSHGSDEDEG
ncbi:MAG: hypothetical protein ACYSWO_28975 [Planctomycetota bacterium]|jgi:hypothetical protein